MGVGFIRDKLEIKFLILYIAARVSEPLPLEGMQELTMCDDGIDYFAFSECLADLVKTEHLRLTDDGCYAITPKGLRNSEICESSLPYSVRIRTDKNVAAYNKKLLRRSQVRARVTPRENGTFTVELSFHDDVDELMQLLRANGLKLYGAALTDAAQDLRRVPFTPAAVAIGSEGRGLSAQLLAQCDGQIIIPMQPGAESLNAAVAAAVVMWEIARTET